MPMMWSTVEMGFGGILCLSLGCREHEPRSPPLRSQQGLTAVIYTFLDSTTPLRLYTSNTYVIASNLYSPAIRLTVLEACQILLVSRTPYILDLFQQVSVQFVRAVTVCVYHPFSIESEPTAISLFMQSTPEIYVYIGCSGIPASRDSNPLLLSTSATTEEFPP